jgi:hypothetical protein
MRLSLFIHVSLWSAGSGDGFGLNDWFPRSPRMETVPAAGGVGVGVGVGDVLELLPPHPAVMTASASAPRVELIKRMYDSIPRFPRNRAGTIPVSF